MNKGKTRILIYEPEVLFWGVAAGFHGYATTFINNYADCIYIKKGLKKALKYRRQLWKIGIKRYIPFIHTLKDTDKKYDALIGFVVPAEQDDELFHFKSKKYFHLMDYYLFVSRNQKFLERYKIDYVIGHTQMDRNCDFFKRYYPQYIGKTLSLPFGYQNRFICMKPFENRKNIAIGLGSINPTNDPLLDEDSKKEFLEYYSENDFMHPLRRYIQTHEKEYADVIEARFPSPDKQKDFSYDSVEVLNDYKMFINDAGLSNFPPARTYEGIACGCVMVAEESDIYKELGFVSGENYIGFERGNYNQMREKILYYIQHEDELEKIHEKSLKLSKKFSHDEVAHRLMEMVESERGAYR